MDTVREHLITNMVSSKLFTVSSLIGWQSSIPTCLDQMKNLVCAIESSIISESTHTKECSTVV